MWSRRWRHIVYPCFGQRIIEGRAWRGYHAPLISWGYYASAAWFSPRLIAISFIGLLPTLGLIFLGFSNAATQLGVALIALVLLGFIATALLRPRLEIRCDLPPRVMEGTDFTIHYTVTNRSGWLPAYDVSVDSLPFPYILELRARPAMLAYLAPGEQTVIAGTGRAIRRGLYRLQPLRWDSDFPFGLWRWGRTDWSDRMLHVYPSHPSLASLEIPAGMRHRRETHSARHLTREALEFHGCREFRSGDMVRHIHPRSSARLGLPVVKEFQAEGRGRVAVVVDTWKQFSFFGSEFYRDTTVEASLALAASIVDHIARSDRVLELLVAGPTRYRFESAGRFTYVEDVLDILAAIEPARRDPLPLWAPELLEEIREIQSAVLILTRWDAVRAALVDELVSREIGLKIVLIQPHRRWLFYKKKRTELTAPHHLQVIDAGAVLRGEVTSL